MVHLTTLTLTDNDLAEFPLSIVQAEWLERLSIAQNRISTLPPELGRLTRLVRSKRSYPPLNSPVARKSVIVSATSIPWRSKTSRPK